MTADQRFRPRSRQVELIGNVTIAHPGMSIRDYFAAAALQGMMGSMRSRLIWIPMSLVRSPQAIAQVVVMSLPTRCWRRAIPKPEVQVTIETYTV